jgi:DNA-binding SARP family transcriptional activator/predicted ATPase
MALEMSLLGPPRVERGGERVAFDTRKAMALLAHLALADGARPREALCSLLWPTRDPDHARGALRRTLSTLRTAIGEQWIDTAGDSIALKQGPGLELDVARFRELVARDASLKSLTEAVELHSGGFMEGFSLRDSPDFDDWQIAQTDAIERELAAALRRLVELLAARGEYERALPHARRWLEIDPLHEPAHRELIRLYAWSGDRAAALEQYRSCVRTLSQELGVSPLDETANLYEQVNDGSLAPPPKATAPPSERAAPRAATPPLKLPLVGRADALATLTAAHAGARPDGALAVIEGEAGVGKTRLANELAGHAQAMGAVVLAARCHDDEVGIPYGPVVELLREAAMDAGGASWPESVPGQRMSDASLLLPELAELRMRLPAPLPLEGPGAQVRLLEGVAAVITAATRGPQPGVVFLDDVHAADDATVDAISFLGRRLNGRSLLLVISWRSEGVPPGHRLRRLAADLVQAGEAVIVSPARLDERDVATLLENVHPGEEVSELARLVYVESEGLPLFVAEYLTARQEGGDPAEGLLPTGVRSVLDARLGKLGDVARQVLGAAAAIGRSFDLQTVRDASGRSEEETIDALDELVAQGVVLEAADPEPLYDFSHQKLRDAMYEQTSLARRRLLHRRVAAAIAKRQPGAENAALVAAHLRLAGDYEGAADRYRVAAEHAVSLHAYADALEQLEAALALGADDTSALHERIGDLRTLMGDYGGALASYETAAAQSESPAALAAIEHKLGEVHQRRGEWERAEARFVAALEKAPDDDRGLRSRIQADLALALHHSGRSEHATALAREALQLAESADDQRAEAQTHNLLGVLARGAGETKSALSELERSLALADELDDDSAKAAALNNLALVRRDTGDLSEALAMTEKALRLCAAQGDRHRQAALENNLADIHHAAGDEEAAMTHLKRAVAIFSEVGADEATRLPEIWKLVSW